MNQTSANSYREALARALEDDTSENRKALIEAITVYDNELDANHNPDDPSPWPSFATPHQPEPSDDDPDADD